MEIDAQTLVLIDNSLSVSKVNREITKLTLQYLFSHSPEGRAYCFAPFAHELDYVESYTTDYLGLEDMAYRLEYENKDTSITDTLTDVLDKWQEGDFACRNILIFTDGIQEEAVRYREEELFYVINNASYPIYVVLLDQQQGEEALMDMSAICRLSGGKLFSTEFEGSDAEVERKLTEQIFNAMSEYEEQNWALYNDEDEEDTEDEKESDSDEVSPQIEEIVSEEVELSEAMAAPMEEVIYSQEAVNPLEDALSMAFLGGGLFLAICACFICWCLFIRSRKRKQDDEEEYRKRIVSQISDSSPENDSMTRLLYETSDGIDISFEDAADPSKYFRKTLLDRLRLGRALNQCDVAFEYEDSVSAVHCELSRTERCVYVKDLKSSNGTYINGQKVYDTSQLRDGDMLKLGLLSLIVRF